MTKRILVTIPDCYFQKCLGVCIFFQRVGASFQQYLNDPCLLVLRGKNQGGNTIFVLGVNIGTGSKRFRYHAFISIDDCIEQD